MSVINADSDTIKAILAFFAGLSTYFSAPKIAALYDARNKPGEKERFLEQRRAYKAYPYLRNPGFYRGVGLTLMLLAIAMLALAITN